MTNLSPGNHAHHSGTSSGTKRAWDAHGALDTPEESKRSRSDNEPRDWRDVHLKEGESDTKRRGYESGAGSASSRRESPDRDRVWGRDGRGRGGRGEGRRDSGYGRDGRDRDREKGRSSRYRDRDDSRRRTTDYRKDDYPPRHPSHRPRSRTGSPGRRSAANGSSRAISVSASLSAKGDNEEKEEGEISPVQRSRSSRSRSPQQTNQEPSPSNAPPSQPPSQSQNQDQQMDLELDIPPSPPPVEDILAARRAKRLAILAKYAGTNGAGASPSPALQQPPSRNEATEPPPTPMTPATPAPVSSKDADGDVNMATSSKRPSLSRSPTPSSADFLLAKDEDTPSEKPSTVGEHVSAADYDPSLDRREDEQRRVGGAPPGGNGVVKEERMDVEEIIEEEDEEEEEEEVDDMFAVATAPTTKKTIKKKKKTTKVKAAPALITTTALDSASDAEGYYTVILGEHLDGGRYQVFSSLGQGMFANVVRARELVDENGIVPLAGKEKEVAIKIVRSQESMYRAGLKEVLILHKLKAADPDDKKHIVRLERTFEHRGHLCLVFESMSMNLRDVVKRFGKDVGLNIRAVRAYAHQLFLALTLLKKLNIMHADIKPDNILVNEQKNLLKLCDLGSASDASENDITPYLVSRFYRAPEIILGVPYDPSLDIWSIGCTLYELYTGKILFPGRSNNQMLLLMMELKGRFNQKMVKKAKFGSVYFDEMGGFVSVEKDKVTGSDVVRTVHISKPSRDLRSRLMPPASVKMKDDENKMVMSFIDLLDKCLALDPGRRITPREALLHPFIRG